MRTKCALTIAATLVALAAFATFGIFRETRPVQAQDQQPPPIPERISFGMVGLTRGQVCVPVLGNVSFVRRVWGDSSRCRSHSVRERGSS